MRTLPVLIALALVAGPARAGVYNIIASDADSVAVIDPAATKFDRGARLFSAWTVEVKRHLTDDASAAPGYIRTLNEYDCVGRQLRWRTVMVYSRFGALLLQKDNSAPAWVSGYQGQGQDPNLRAVCDEATAGAVSAPTLAQLVISLMQAWDPPAGAPAAVIAAPAPVAKKR